MFKRSIIVGVKRFFKSFGFFMGLSSLFLFSGCTNFQDKHDYKSTITRLTDGVNDYINLNFKKTLRNLIDKIELHPKTKKFYSPLLVNTLKHYSDPSISINYLIFHIFLVSVNGYFNYDNSYFFSGALNIVDSGNVKDSKSFTGSVFCNFKSDNNCNLESFKVITYQDQWGNQFPKPKRPNDPNFPKIFKSLNTNLFPILQTFLQKHTKGPKDFKGLNPIVSEKFFRWVKSPKAWGSGWFLSTSDYCYIKDNNVIYTSTINWFQLVWKYDNNSISSFLVITFPMSEFKYKENKWVLNNYLSVSSIISANNFTY